MYNLHYSSRYKTLGYISDREKGAREDMRWRVQVDMNPRQELSKPAIFPIQPDTRSGIQTQNESKSRGLASSFFEEPTKARRRERGLQDRHPPRHQ